MNGSDPASMAFFTTAYGEKYFPLLLPHLYSVQQRHPQAPGLLIWAEMPPHLMRMLATALPAWRLEQLPGKVEGGLHQRIARKLHLWRRACGAFPDQPICFIDCDTVVVRRLEHFLDCGADIVFTWKDAPFPLNTGVILARSGRAAEGFFSAWCAETEAVLRDEQALALALGCSGAADQHALRRMIGFVHYDGQFEREIGGARLRFRGVPCRELNETNSVPLTSETHVVHYKTAWHPILLEGGPYTVHRTEEACAPMRALWMQTAQDAAAWLASEFVTRSAAQHRARFAQIAGEYEERGILHSEMLACCATCAALDVDLIIESGRCRGQSTSILGRFFAGSDTQIISIELERDENAEFAERRLAEMRHVTLRYGDSLELLPQLLREHAGRRIALLLDGPKGAVAISLLQRCLTESDNISCAFLHDLRQGVPQRQMAQRAFPLVFFTDAPAYIDEYGELDAACLPKPGRPITVHTWRPFHKGQEQIESYGPTLGVIFPSPVLFYQEPEALPPRQAKPADEDTCLIGAGSGARAP